eukprot:scaffold1942_cov197-Alexandrium_tamarense.AAC.6
MPTRPHPLQQHHQQQQRQGEDWHKYTLHTPKHNDVDNYFNTPTPPNNNSSNSASGHTTLPLPNNLFQYESLTGLLLQTGSTPTFGIDDDNESYKHHSNFNMEEEFDNNLHDGGGERRNATRRRRSALEKGMKRVGKKCCGLCRRMGWNVSMKYDSPCAILLGMMGVASVGVILGVLFPSNDATMTAPADLSPSTDDVDRWNTTSNILGYTYFLSWTLSFYPQIITNYLHPHKARHGVSLDFVVWNIVGFACYAVYVTCFRYSDVVREEYADRFGSGGATTESGVDGEDDEVNTHNSTSVSVVVDGMLSSMSRSFISSYQNGTLYNSTDGYSHDINSTSDHNWGNSTANTTHDTTNSNTTDDTSSDDMPIAVPQVKANDVAFAWHALILTIVTFVQIVWFSDSRSDRGDDGEMDGSQCEMNRGWIEVEGGEDVHADDLSTAMDLGESESLYRRRRSPHNRSKRLNSIDEQHWTKRISSTTKCLIFLLLLSCAGGVVMVATEANITYWGGGEQWQWIDYLYFLSFVKVGVTTVKYIPQVVLNYQRKSTEGWQIWNILLDFSGGTLSIVQLIGDSMAEARVQGLQHDWTGVIGNPAKFGLGLVSILFDVSVVL